MKSTVIGLLAAGWITLSGAAQEKPVQSSISAVTVFLNRAQVTRVIKTRLEAGETQLVVQGLPAQLDPQSVQVDGRGKFIIRGVSHRQNFMSELQTPKPIRLLMDSITFYQKQNSWEESQREILVKEEQMLISNQKVGGANQNLSVAELKSMADFFRGRMSEIAANRSKSNDRTRKNSERISMLQQQWQSQNELYSRNSSELVISLSTDAPTAAELDVRYVVQQAGWYPVYELRAADTRSPLVLNYRANVFQSTGEDWRNVRLRLSTGNPAQSGVKPELNPWYLSFIEPIARFRKGFADTMPERKMAVAMDMAGEAAAESLPPAARMGDYVETIQTTLNTTFDISLPYSVASSNQPTLVDIRQHSLTADYTYAVVPKLETDAFLLARATGWEEFSLLPGEANIFFEGAFVGKSIIDPSTTGDTLAISLGRDPRIVVKREKHKELTSRGLMGANKRESHAWDISVRNTKAEAITITIEDQVPVSQNSQIEVSNIVADGASRNAVTGMLRWELKIQPNETRKVGLRYDVKYPKDRKLNL